MVASVGNFMHLNLAKKVAIVAGASQQLVARSPLPNRRSMLDAIPMRVTPSILF